MTLLFKVVRSHWCVHERLAGWFEATGVVWCGHLELRLLGFVQAGHATLAILLRLLNRSRLVSFAACHYIHLFVFLIASIESLGFDRTCRLSFGLQCLMTNAFIAVVVVV